MDFTVAAPPSYVGVATGETYIWRASVSADNLDSAGEALFGSNWAMMYDTFEDFWENLTHCPWNFFQGAGLKVVLTNVSDEITAYYPSIPASGIYLDEWAAGCNDNYTLVYNSSGVTWPMMYVLDPSYLGPTNWQYYITSYYFTSIGLDWTDLADYWQDDVDSSPYTAGNVTITPLSNGLDIELKDKYLEYLLYLMGGSSYVTGPLSDAEITLTWNSKGVFQKAVLEYGGVEIATAYLEEGIPGYEFSIFMGITAATIVGLIYVIKKKKK